MNTATVVRRLRAAGAIILGKTNTPELTVDRDVGSRVVVRPSFVTACAP